LEQVHVTGLIRRCLRLELVAAMGIALAVPAASFAAQSPEAARASADSPSIATQTTLSAEAHDRAGRTSVSLSVSVAGDDSQPATGAVTITDQGRTLASAALNAKGETQLALDLPGGDHSLSAVYSGDATHRASVSEASPVHALSSGTPDFAISVAPVSPATFPLTLTAGNTGAIAVTITPENNSSLTAPMFITLSCSGMPDESSCTFTPENVEILPTTLASCTAGSQAANCPPTSNMVVITQKASSLSYPKVRPGSNPVALALLLPGAFSLGGIAFALRRRAWLQRLSLLALLAVVATLGTTACNPRYDYLNHGPPPNPATPSGTYTIDVTAQSSNGVTATTHTTSFTLTVN
jgi:hypothetical protein